MNFLPVAVADKKSLRFFMVMHTITPHYLVGNTYADKRLRPLARRAFITRRPPTVAIRARKPWRRLRTRLLGWNVLFIFFLHIPLDFFTSRDIKNPEKSMYQSGITMTSLLNG